MFIHHTNVKDAEADGRKLVCYDCGIACDLTRMQSERLAFLQKMGAETAGERARLPLLSPGSSAGPSPAGQSSAARSSEAQSFSAQPGQVQSPEEERLAPGEEAPSANGAAPPPPKRGASPERYRPPRPGSPPERYRLRYAKRGPSALLGHLDFIRELPRVIRRAGVRTAYTEGFHPKPDMSFGPALALGIASLDEYIDVKLIDAPDPTELVVRLNQVTSGGVEFLGAARLGPSDRGLSKLVDQAEYVIGFPRSALREGTERAAEEVLASWISAFHDKEEAIVLRDVKGLKKKIDVKAGVSALLLGGEAERQALGAAGVVGALEAIRVVVPLSQAGAVRSREIVEALSGSQQTPYIAVRTRLSGGGESLLDLSAQAVPARPEPSPAQLGAV